MRASRWPARIALTALALGVPLTVFTVAWRAFYPPSESMVAQMGAGTPFSAFDLALLDMAFLSGGLVGLLVIRQQPRNMCGWWLLLVGVLGPTVFALQEVYLMESTRQPDLPWLELATWFGRWLWAPVVYGPLAVLPLLFPDGRLPGRRWWPVAAAVYGLLFFVMFVGAFSEDAGSTNRLAIPWVSAIALQVASSPLLNFVLQGQVSIFGGLALIGRYRNSGHAVRQQIKWFVSITLVALGVMFLWPIVFASDTPAAVFSLCITAIFVGLGIAILRGKVWDINIVIRRTLIYGALTLLLGAIYVGVITVLQQGLVALTGRGDSQLVTVASTLAVAGAFLPLRNRVQAFVDRRFYRRKYDATLVAARFANEIRDTVTMDDVTTKLFDAVEDTMQPQKMALWVSNEATKP